MPTNTEERTTTNWMKEVQKGYIRVATLIVLSRKPSHGYEIMKEIKDKTGGFYRPTPGGVYPILRSLEKAGYVEGEWGTHRNRKIKVYKITEKGKNILKHAIIKQSEIAKSINTLAEEFAREVLSIEPKIAAMPIMSNPFATFLGEENEEKQDAKQLENLRKNLQNNIGLMQEKLKLIDTKIKEAKTGKNKKE
jgi:DNA-binding PadR family transcriptional regulator